MNRFLTGALLAVTLAGCNLTYDREGLKFDPAGSGPPTCVAATPDACNGFNVQSGLYETYCADFNSDARNCGGCGNDCGPLACRSGHCDLAGCPGILCDAGSGQYCSDTLSDPNNCGGCGDTGFGASYVCEPGGCNGSGSCDLPCPTEWICRSGLGYACTDLSNDPKNCGGCGIDCGWDDCRQGACHTVSCGGSTIECRAPTGWVCANLSNDEKNCGACNNPCGPGATCNGGTCEGGTTPTVSCVESGVCTEYTGVLTPTQHDTLVNGCGYLGGTAHDLPCGPDSQVPGTCEGVANPLSLPMVAYFYSPTYDAATAPGACSSRGGAWNGGSGCGSYGTCNAGYGQYCADTSSDPYNCGALCEPCGLGAACLAGSCTAGCYDTVCSTGAGYPGHVCADLQNDPNHCGSCGNACVGTTCSGGTCAVTLGAVEPLLGPYTPVGALWNDWIIGVDWSQALVTQAACDASYTVPCVHGGELRRFKVSGRSVCDGLAAVDDLWGPTGAFTWTCTNQINDGQGDAQVWFVSTGLKPGLGLRDLVGPTQFKTVSVTVTGAGPTALTTPGATWANNVVATLPIEGVLDGYPGPNAVYVWNGDPANMPAVQVVKSGVSVLLGTSAQPYAPITAFDAVYVSWVGFAWVEGEIDGANAAAGVSLNNVNRSTLRNVVVERGPGRKSGPGILLSSSNRNDLENVESRNSWTCLDLQSSSENRLKTIDLSSCYVGLHVQGASDANLVQQLRVGASEWSGIQVNLSKQNVLKNVTVSGTTGIGIVLDAAHENALVDVVSAANLQDGIVLSDARDNRLVSVTAARNGYSGVLMGANAHGNVLANAALFGNDIGLSLYTVSGTLVTDVAATDNRTEGIYTIDSPTTWVGELRLGFNGTGPSWDCVVAGNLAIAGISSSCTGMAPSLYVRTTRPVSLSNAFVGRLGQDDWANVADAGGYGNFAYLDDRPPYVDWTHFGETHRAWGLADGGFGPLGCWAGAGARTDSLCASWMSGGAIFDWGLSWGDPGIARAVLVNPSSLWPTSAPPYDEQPDLIHGWWAGGTSFILRHAREQVGDWIGDDDGLCESSETCLYTPNLGAYQGEAPTVPLGLFDFWNVFGVTMETRQDANGRPPGI
jgi:hypothetical protein